MRLPEWLGRGGLPAADGQINACLLDVFGTADSHPARARYPPCRETTPSQTRPNPDLQLLVHSVAMSLGAHARLAQAIALLACFASLASGADVLMTFRGDPVIPPGTYQPQMDLALGDSHTYYFNTAVTNGSTFDFEILLDVLRGDADLVVEGPISDPSGEEPRTPTLQVRADRRGGLRTALFARAISNECTSTIHRTLCTVT